MTTNPVPARVGLNGRRRGDSIRTATALVLAAILPALAGVVLLGSVALRRPLLGRWLASPGRGAPNPATTGSPAPNATSLTVLWGVGMIIAGALQGVPAFVAGVSITDPTGFLMRTLVGVAAEAVLFFVSMWWLR